MRLPRSRSARTLISLACLSMVISGLFGCEKGESPTSRKPKLVVRVTRPTTRDVTDYAFFTGRTESPESVNVQSRVTGYLDTVDFKPGSEVKAGQRLFLIDPRPYQAALDRAIGDVNLAKAQWKLAIADYARAVEIAKTPGAISQQDIDKYAASRDEASAAVASAEANSESARLNVEFTRILSPVDGVVGRNLLTIGNLVKQDETLLTTVVSQDPMYAYFDIDEYTLLRLERLIKEKKISRSDRSQGFPVEMGLADEGERYPHQGRIDFVNNRVDPNTGTLQMRGTFANPSLEYKNIRLLSPGMFVRIRLPLGEPHPALLVPEKAVCTNQARKYLLAVNKQNVVEYRPITLGPQQPGGLQVILPAKMILDKGVLRELQEGEKPDGPLVDSVSADDRIIVEGLQRVKPGVTVEARDLGEEVASASSDSGQARPPIHPGKTSPN